jgi:thiosulfate/3-mercaptopyruvate sulfurtransferase
LVTLPLLPLLLGAVIGATRPGATGDSLLVSVDWLKAHLNDRNLVILDFRHEKADYDKGHIPGAQFVGMDAIWRSGEPGVELPSVAALDSTFEALGISDQSRVVIYGSTWMAPRVFLDLDYLGHGDHAAMLDGGLPAWEKAGLKLSVEPVHPARGTFTPRPRPDIVVDAKWVNAHRTDRNVRLLDGRSEGEYTGTDHSEQLPRSGHIPGAINLPWEQTFTDGKAALEGNPSPLKSAGELKALLAGAGITPPNALVAYCTVGMRAAHWYFVARLLGFEPKIYDGSMREWSPKTDLPVVEGK